VSAADPTGLGWRARLSATSPAPELVAAAHQYVQSHLELYGPRMYAPVVSHDMLPLSAAPEVPAAAVALWKGLPNRGSIQRIEVNGAPVYVVEEKNDSGSLTAAFHVFDKNGASLGTGRTGPSPNTDPLRWDGEPDPDAGPAPAPTPQFLADMRGQLETDPTFEGECLASSLQAEPYSSDLPATVHDDWKALAGRGSIYQIRVDQQKLFLVQESDRKDVAFATPRLPGDLFLDAGQVIGFRVYDRDGGLLGKATTSGAPGDPDRPWRVSWQ
jgi:hypothetical protein